MRGQVAAGLLGVVLILTGCAQSGVGSAGSSGGQVPSAGASPGVGSSSSAGPSGGASGSLPLPSTSAAAMVLTGQVEAGVEARCLVLRDSGKTYQLLGGDPAVVKVGARVRVTGNVAIGVMSYCMQGTPFRVTAAEAL